MRATRAYWNDEVHEGVIPQAATRMKRAAARPRVEIGADELLALAARRTIWGDPMAGTSHEATALVGQVWEPLLPAGLRAEFPLPGRGTARSPTRRHDASGT